QIQGQKDADDHVFDEQYVSECTLVNSVVCTHARIEPSIQSFIACYRVCNVYDPFFSLDADRVFEGSSFITGRSSMDRRSESNESTREGRPAYPNSIDCRNRNLYLYSIVE